jgi:processive 1,2-diacylglycerol beta-glucosyltransferase
MPPSIGIDRETGETMIKLYDLQTGAPIGEITQTQLDFLIGQLEEESATDTDYYINADTLDYFAQQGADATLITLLRSALAGRPDMDIRWDVA